MSRRQVLSTTGAVASIGFCVGIVASAPGCTPPPTAEPINGELAFAIARHRAALADVEASGRLQSICDEALMLLETPVTQAAFDAADDAFALDGKREKAAHHGVIAAPVRSVADMHAKAAHLASVADHIEHDDRTMGALLASMSEGA